MSAVANASMKAPHGTAFGKDLATEPSSSGFTAVNNTRDPVLNGARESPEPAGKVVNGISHRPEHQATIHHARNTPSRDQDTQSREGASGNRRHPSPHHIESPALSPGKRKRSTADDTHGSSSSRYDVSPPRRSTGSPATLLDTSAHRSRGTERDHQTPSASVNGADNHSDHSHGRPWQTNRQNSPAYQPDRAVASLDSADTQMAEALQRDAQQQNFHRPRSSEGPPDNESAEHYATYDADRTSQAVVASSAKRKRTFTNRTKTGCLTCRRRKKKCDEAHPKCNNCIRGDFDCEGYSNGPPWHRTSDSRTPVPLQSKEYNRDTSEPVHSMEGRSPREKRTSAPYEATQRTRPAVMENAGQASHHVSMSPTTAGVANSGSYRQPWSQNRPKNEQARVDLPSISQAMIEHEKPVHAVSQLREGGRSHNNSQHSSSSWASRTNDFGQSFTSSPVQMRGLPGVAREGLYMEESQRSMLKGDEQQKVNMLHGQLFRFNDPLLVDERRRCKIALQHFHDADANIGTSDTERSRLLREIFIPPPNNSMVGLYYPQRPEQPDVKIHPVGQVMPGLVIEAPFYCQYGYNIRFGEDVYIGVNCTIIDACTVRIGSKTWIGQNVQLLTAMAALDLNQRTGSGPSANWQGSPITIEEDVHIASGVTINPGVTIRRGAQIGSGTVVSQNVDAYARLGS